MFSDLIMVSQADLLIRRDEIRKWYPMESITGTPVVCLTEDETKQLKRMDRFHGLIHARYSAVLVAISHYCITKDQAYIYLVTFSY